MATYAVIDLVDVYVLHCFTKLHHAGHYIGSTNNLGRRLEEHLRWKKHLIGAYNRAGIVYVVANVYHNVPRSFEFELKAKKHTSRFCNICRALAGLESPVILPAEMVTKLSPSEATAGTIPAVPHAGDSIPVSNPIF